MYWRSFFFFNFLNVWGSLRGVPHSQHITYISYSLPVASKLGIKVSNFCNYHRLETNLFLSGTIYPLRTLSWTNLGFIGKRKTKYPFYLIINSEIIVLSQFLNSPPSLINSESLIEIYCLRKSKTGLGNGGSHCLF